MASVSAFVFCEHCGSEVFLCPKCEKHGDTEECGASSFICFSCHRSLTWQEEAEQMSSEDLYEALDEVDYDRRKHCVRLRGKTWSAEDQAEHDNMDKYASILFGEIEKRRKQREEAVNEANTKRLKKELTILKKKLEVDLILVADRRRMQDEGHLAELADEEAKLRARLEAVELLLV